MSGYLSLPKWTHEANVRSFSHKGPVQTQPGSQLNALRPAGRYIQARPIHESICTERIRSIFWKSISFHVYDSNKKATSYVIVVLNFHGELAILYYDIFNYLEQRGVVVAVWWRTSTYSWVIEVEINSIEATGSAESDGRTYESRPVSGGFQHECHPLPADVMSSDGYQYLESRLFFSQGKCLIISEMEGLKK